MNDENTDFHIHSNLSDGLNSVDEIVRFAAEIGLKEIAITDHSGCWEYAHSYIGDIKDYKKAPKRSFYERWKNIHHDVKVLKGIEADLLYPNGTISSFSDNCEFVILSAHDRVYTEPEKITEAYLRAIDKYAEKIDIIGHPCANYFAQYLDVEKLAKHANDADIGLELSCANLHKGRTDIKKLREMLNFANSIYVNSDAHTLNELRDLRKKGYEFLKKSLNP